MLFPRPRFCPPGTLSGEGWAHSIPTYSNLCSWTLHFISLAPSAPGSVYSLFPCSLAPDLEASNHPKFTLPIPFVVDSFTTSLPLVPPFVHLSAQRADLRRGPPLLLLAPGSEWPRTFSSLALLFLLSASWLVAALGQPLLPRGPINSVSDCSLLLSSTKLSLSPGSVGQEHQRITTCPGLHTFQNRFSIPGPFTPSISSSTLGRKIAFTVGLASINTRGQVVIELLNQLFM